MKNVNITSLKHLKELLNNFPDDTQLWFQCSPDKENWYNLPAYIGTFGSDENGNDKVVIQICPAKTFITPH